VTMPLAGAMILAAGRGERMRPLSDTTPKPLLRAGGKPLIVWQIEALARAGFRDIVINVAHRAQDVVDALGDGAALGVRLRWSREAEPLETAGGVATAIELIAPGPALIVSSDIVTGFDYASLQSRIAAMRDMPQTSARVHLVMVPNPAWHAAGDFALAGERVELEGAQRLTFGNIGVYDTALFRELPRGVKLKMLPLYRDWIGQRIVSGERYDGPWANVGTPADLAALDAALSR
jgi:N-acetyl-alpha-D-muramate 1-phosphate uridylyltransferase